MAPLAPPSVRTLDAITFRPLRPIVDLRQGALVSLLAVLALTLATGANALPVVIAWLGALVFLRGFRPAQPFEVTLALHRVTVHRAGDPRRALVSVTWDELRAAELHRHRLVLRLRDGRAIDTRVQGLPGQVAWIVGEINARIRRDLLPADAFAELESDRRRVAMLLER